MRLLCGEFGKDRKIQRKNKAEIILMIEGLSLFAFNGIILVIMSLGPMQRNKLCVGAMPIGMKISMQYFEKEERGKFSVGFFKLFVFNNL